MHEMKKEFLEKNFMVQISIFLKNNKEVICLKKIIIKFSLILCISVLLVGCKKDNKDNKNSSVDKSNGTENVLETNDKKEPVIITTTEPEPTIIPKEKDTPINNQDENSEY